MSTKHFHNQKKTPLLILFKERQIRQQCSFHGQQITFFLWIKTKFLLLLVLFLAVQFL